MANTTGKKYGGRQKGTPNKVNSTSSETKQLLQNILTKQIENLETTLDKLEPSERVNALSKLLPYILPKKQDIEIIPPQMSPEEKIQRLKELKEKFDKSGIC